MRVEELAKRLVAEGFQQVLVHQGDPPCLKCYGFVVEKQPDERWLIFTSERGIDFEEGLFEDESSACEAMLNLLLSLKARTNNSSGK